MRGLILKKEWIDLILDGKKDIEIRNKNTKIINEDFYLLESGTQLVRGVCRIKKVEKIYEKKYPKGVIPEEEVEKYSCKWINLLNHHRVAADYRTIRSFFNTPHMWYLDGVRKMDGEVRYEHPAGAQMWIKDVKLMTKE